MRKILALFILAIPLLFLDPTSTAAAPAPGTCHSTFNWGYTLGTVNHPGDGWVKWTLNTPPAGCGNSIEARVHCFNATRAHDFYSGEVTGTGIKDDAKCDSAYPNLGSLARSINNGAFMRLWPPTSGAFSPAANIASRGNW